MSNQNDDRGKRRFTFFDYWFHLGVLINLIVVLLVIWYVLF